MAFAFLSSDFFNVQNRDSSAPSPVMPATPRDPLPRPAVPGTSFFACNSSPNVNTTNLPSFPHDSPSFPSAASDTVRYISRSFVYSTPVNPNTFGAIHDSGYTSLSSRTPNYHLPSTPATSSSCESPTKPTPCETYLKLYESGDLEARKGSTNSWELQCIVCDKWIRTSVPCRRALSIPNHFSNLESHSPSPRKAATTSASAIPTDLSDDNDEEEEEEFRFQYGRSSSLPPEALSNAPPTPSPMLIVQMCPGSPLDWPVDVGPFMETFPFHRIGIQQGSLSFNVEIHDRSTKVIAFSKHCTGEARLNGCCSHCAKIPAEVQRLVDLAVQADSRVNHRYLSWSQIRSLLADRTEKSLNSVRNFATAIRKLADYKRFMDAVAEMNIPRLHQLVSVGLRRGSSPSAIIRMMQSALEGVYRPRPILDSRTLDIALMVYRLGGRKLLYAVNHGLGLPSLRTLRNHMAFTKIMPTVGTISVEDIIHNIREPLLPRNHPRGISLLIDEVALEEHACHFRHNNSIGGLCWRHSPKVDLQLKTYDDALKIAAKIKAEEVHLGKEMTVVSVSCFGESGTYPILALPTCKFVGPAESSMIYETFTAAWLEHAAAKVEMLWSWSTDGESSRRRAGYDQFVRHKLGPTSPIFGTLASMAGLNIFTGIHSITLDFDYKHVFKRLCTLIRSAAGMALCNGRIINPAVLTRFLARLPDQSDDSVRKLLFPDDPQDVPRAVELMEAIIELIACDFGQVDANTAADLDSIRLLALILKSILAPFITPDMSLTEQMTHLSTYAHLTFTLFCMNRLTFMSNQLYGDSQSMIKNAFFCLAKKQKLDPTQPSYLFQVGDDPLERLFGKLRMLGGHNSAMSYAQAIERLGHACDLQAVYLRQPDLDQGQRRISMKRSEGVDHLNMVSWTGHAIAGDCHILSAWDEGSKIARGIFEKLRFPPQSYNYAAIFSNPEIDMLRPFGDGKYPGVESDTDRSMIVPKATSATSPSSTPSPSTSTSAPSTSTSDPSTSATPTPSAAPFKDSTAANPSDETTATHDDDDDIDDQGDGIPFEDTLDEVPELALPSGRGVDPNDYISVEGKWVHKQRICRVVINADFEPKSTERLKRVRGHTKVNAKKRDDVNPEALLGANTFIVGDPFFTLLRTDQTLSLAVVRSTAIHEDGISRGSILAPTIRNPMAKVKLSGQVLSLTMIPTLDDNLPQSESALVRPRPPSHEDLRSPDWISEEKSPWSWIFNGRFLKVDSAIAGTKQTTEKVVIVSIPGVLTELVNHRPVDAVPRLGECAYAINSEGRSWELDNGPMGAVCELLWDVVVKEKITLTSITSVKKTADFPYAFDNGKPALICQEGTQQLIQQHDNKVQRICHLCDERPGNWRAHISTHILRCIRGVKEALRMPHLIPAQIGTSLPCGFCAFSGKPECEVHIRKKGPTTHVETNCAMVSAFNYKPAEQGSRASPCRNVPVVCKLCFPDVPRPGQAQRAQWRYNMPEHLSTAHPEYSSPLSPGGTRLPHEVWESMKIDTTEELALGIPDASIPAVFEDVAGPDEGLDRANVVGRKRGRKTAPGTSQRRR
ncbi:hypothetical protein MVEN_00912000 [Mycena venus]|uniref:Uncharacterized protein n=1 Tax=Mycena venus TaxID=2733690 RepID=A0A8H6YCA9_9AGAR|nr:hypothetical protein MVEN_00912000 [Mycena venus]